MVVELSLCDKFFYSFLFRLSLVLLLLETLIDIGSAASKLNALGQFLEAVRHSGGSRMSASLGGAAC